MYIKTIFIESQKPNFMKHKLHHAPRVALTYLDPNGDWQECFWSLLDRDLRGPNESSLNEISNPAMSRWQRERVNGKDTHSVLDLDCSTWSYGSRWANSKQYSGIRESWFMQAEAMVFWLSQHTPFGSQVPFAMSWTTANHWPILPNSSDPAPHLSIHKFWLFFICFNISKVKSIYHFNSNNNGSLSHHLPHHILPHHPSGCPCLVFQWYLHILAQPCSRPLFTWPHSFPLPTMTLKCSFNSTSLNCGCPPISQCPSLLMFPTIKM